MLKDIYGKKYGALEKYTVEKFSYRIFSKIKISKNTNLLFI